MNGKLKWIIPLGVTVILALGGVAYASLDGRVKRNEFSLDTTLPLLYEIKAQSTRNGEDIQKLLGRREDDTPN